MSEDSMWHDYDTVFPSDKDILREKEHLTGFLVMCCENDTKKISHKL